MAPPLVEVTGGGAMVICGLPGAYHPRMADLPTGTVTLLFTDIEGSTRLLTERGEAYLAALAEHRRSLREVFARHQGVEVDTQGDAFFCAFASARNAVAAARDAQESLRDGPVRVRIGIHTGEPQLTAAEIATIKKWIESGALDNKAAMLAKNDK